MSAAGRPRWARALFGCAGADLPPEVVLLARLVAVAWLLTGHALLVPARSAPFFEALAPLADSAFLGWALFVVGLACAAQLVVGRSVRASALALGGVIAASTLLSRAYFSNNRAYTACVLALAGLAATRGPPTLLRAQVALLYVAAGADKLLDPDWRSGAFLRSFASGLAAHGRLWSPGHDAATPWAPARLVADALDRFGGLAAVASWGVILLELGVGVAFLARRGRVAIAFGIAFHVGTLVYTGSPMGMFFYTATAAYLAYVRLPAAIEVRADPRAHARLLAALRALDADGRCRVEHGPGLRATVSGETHAGAAAALAIALHLPAFYVVAAAALAGPWFTPWSALALGLLLLWGRPFAPAPERAEVRDVTGELDA